jgi:hypothetical protein
MRTVIIPADINGYHIKFDSEQGPLFFAGYGQQKEILVTNKLEDSGVLDSYREAQAIINQYSEEHALA